MARRAAKELLHVQEWLGRVDEITRRGKHAYFQDPLMQEAGDSLMMKLGEAANGCRDWTSSPRRASTGHSRSRIGTSSSTSTTRSTVS
jgi:hypothetical protein